MMERALRVIHKVLPVRVGEGLEGRVGGKLPQGRRGRGSAWGSGIILERVLAVGGGPLPGHKLLGLGSSIECSSHQPAIRLAQES
jgi:hypothetical protein